MDKSGLVHEALRHTIGALPPWVGHSRADALDTAQVAGQAVEETPRHRAPVTCGFTPFYDHNVLLPNGDVVLCCMDYSLKHKVGNLIEDDYFSIFGSPGMARLHVENARPEFSDKSICKSCSRAVRYELAGERQFWRVARG